MEKGTSFATRIIEKSLDDESKLEIDSIIRESSTYTYIKPNFEEDISDYKKDLTEDELITLRGYTGLNFKKINAILRNTWNYEEHGKKTEEDEKRFREDIEVIDKMIDTFPRLNSAIITYRGSTLNSFKKYGISSIEDLLCLKNKYLYEEGYTSTSLSEESSYFNKEILGKVNNIETRYIIPPNSQDGMPLTDDNLSYSPTQEEYILGRNSLSKVIDVKINNDTAIITAVLIPKRIWNKKTKSDEKGMSR